MIKLFEDYNQYYTEIDWLEYKKNCGYLSDSTSCHQLNYLVFIKDEIDQLKKLMPNNKIEINSLMNMDTNQYRLTIYYPNKIYLCMSLDKMEDEWFYVEERNSYAYMDAKLNINPHTQYYKCDQFEGLLKLIEDKKKDPKFEHLFK